MKKLGKLLVTFVACFAMLAAFAACTQETQQQTAPDTDIQETQPAATTTTTSSEAFWVLIVGNDTRLGTTGITQPAYANGNARSDVCMLMRIDPVNYQITIVSVPRDTQIDVNGTPAKINSAYETSGIQGTLAQVKSLTGVDCKYYFDMDFVEFENFVDGLGGITANVPIDMSLKDIVNGGNISLSAGTQTLNGPEALVLARSRKCFATDQDALRQVSDRALVEAGIKQVAADPVNAALHAQTLVQNCDTNWDLTSLSAMVADFAAHAGEISFYSGTGPYDGAIEESTGLWLAYRDEATWASIIAVCNEGGDPNVVFKGVDFSSL